MNKLKFLYLASLILQEEKSLDDGLGEVIKLTAETMKLTKSMLTILDESDGSVFIECSTGLTPEQTRKGSYMPDEGVIGSVLKTGERIVIPNIAKNPRFLNKTKSRTNPEKEKTAFICIPINDDDKVIGTYCADFSNMEKGKLVSVVQIMQIISVMVSKAVVDHIRKNSIQSGAKIR